MPLVKVVTDSTSDLPVEIARKYDITVVPLYVKFGEKEYRDGVDITPDEFYEKLVGSTDFPKTSQPSLQDFIDVYSHLAEKGNDIISIHLSKKLSGTYNAASIAREHLEKCNIEVVDSGSAAMGLGLIDIAAAKLAQTGATLEEVKNKTNDTIPLARVYAVLNTLEYLKEGGRIGDAGMWLASSLNVKPIVTIKNGRASPSGITRSFDKAIEKLYEIGTSPLIEAISVFYTTDAEQAERLAERIEASTGKIPYLTRFTPVMGAHTGPGTLGIAFIEKP